MSRVVLTVPCFNEERRLDVEAFLGLARTPGLELLFVDDGSTDGTAARLRALVAQVPEKTELFVLEKNRGKAEAVRRGMLRSLEAGASVAGYIDADLATPPTEIARLVGTLAECEASVILGSRVRLLGSDVQRRAVRHYLGRVFATSASLVLQVPVYDTQCGAKLFRDTPALRAALAEPFLSPWAFDVELLGRLLAGAEGVPGLARESFVEVPLRSWRDVAGSKIRLRDMALMGVELLRIQRDLARRRRRAGVAS